MQVYPSQGGNGLVVKLAIHVLRGAKPQSARLDRFLRMIKLY